MKISRVEDMRTLDAIATEKYGIPSEILMENAGESTYFVISKELKLKGKKFLIFCGSGNNGGDGLVVARKIHSNGGKVEILLLESEDKFRGSVKKNFEIVTKIGIEIRKIGNIEDVKEEIEKSDAIIDAIFGTGLSGNVEGVYKEVIKLINDSNKPVFSIDIPSGINGNNGKIMRIAIKASHTVTFGLPKLGNIFHPGYEHCGKLYVSHISFPPSIYEHLKIEINEPLKIPERKKDEHKGDFGDVLFVAGSAGYLGPPYLSSMSFIKAGGGYFRLATPKSIIPYIANKGCEMAFVSMEETESGSIALKNEDKILELTKKVDMVVLGSGLSLNEETQELVRILSKKVNKPILIEGDGLTAIFSVLDVIKNRKEETILIPHLSEMSKITKKTVKELDENKITILRKTSEEMKTIIVLKGTHSLIGYPNGKAYINMSGNCGMAKAGSGDVLTGTIAAMFGLGLNIGDAVRTGVFIHGLSGDLASLDKGEDGTTALDIMDYLPSTMKHYREKLDIIKEKYNLQII